jgi:tetratricopeptide (TPR) repeat protein
MKRRSFLSSALALPVISEFLRETPAYAETAVHHAPYLALQPYVQPGQDEFPEELEAVQAEAALRTAVNSRKLPMASIVRGKSLVASNWKQVSPDVSEALFQESVEDTGASFARWIESLGSVRRAQFFILPEDTVRYEVASSKDERILYTTGHWKASWKGGQLLALAPLDENRATAGEPLFRDVTASVFEGCAAFRDQLSRGSPYWRSCLDPASGIDIYGSNGIAVGDIDGDGVDEVFVCQPGGLPNRLFKFREGRFEDITHQWGLPLLDDTSAALFLDLRNSGRQDLVVLRSLGPLLYVNKGDRFELQQDAFHFATSPKGGFTGIAAADYDRDGKLDLYLCTYVYFQSEAQYTYPVPYHDAQNGPPNFLLRNRLNQDGSGFFEDVTAESGVNENSNRFSFAPAWCDTNGDGWPDLYVANDFGRNNFYRNKQGRFSDEAANAGIEDMGPGMSASWFDYNGDGLPDLYVANMWSASGQRIVHSPKFLPAQGEGMAEAYRRHTKGNSLYRNRGDGTFEETSEKQRVAMGRWAWSSVGYDFDNDGSPEILIGSGMLSNVSQKDLMSFFWRHVVARSPQKAQSSPDYENGWNAINQFIREQFSWSGSEPNVFYARRGDRYFDVSGISGVDFADDTRAFSITDFDGDGRPDIILKSRLGPQIRVLQNNSTPEHHSIAFELCGTKSNRDAIGAKIECNGRAVWLSAESGYLSQHSKRLIVGLGKTTGAVDVRVTWPSGTRQEFPRLTPGYTYRLTEDAADWARKAFAARTKIGSKAPESDNRPALATKTWLIEPIPLPQPVSGPALLVLKGLERIPALSGVPVRVLDFASLTAAQQDAWRIFRRYLFDYRVDLVTPFCLLVNDKGNAAKIYAKVPTTEGVRADIASLKTRSPLAGSLPFEGIYLNQPHRDFFKFAAAMLWGGYTGAALPYLTEILQRGRETPRVLMLVGHIHLQSNRLAEAEHYFRKALALDPKYSQAWSELGAVYEARQDLPKALASFEKALSFEPDAAYILLNAAQAAEKLNEPAKAGQYYRNALTVDSKNADAANGLGLLLAKQGNTSEAKALFEQAIQLRRDYGSAINNLGVLYLNTGQINDAVAAFQYGLGVAPDEDILYLNLGRIYARQGQSGKAREVMRRLLARKPGDATAAHALEELDRRQ